MPVQMVEQFEDRVEDRLDEMEAKLKVAEGLVQAPEAIESEKISFVSRQVLSWASEPDHAIASVALFSCTQNVACGRAGNCCGLWLKSASSNLVRRSQYLRQRKA